MSATDKASAEIDRKRGMQIIILFGLVSLCGDIIYEGGRSVNGPYLKILGANAAAVGFVAGLSEFFGYGIRLVSGYLSDRLRAYWAFIFIGYGLLISVPLLSWTGAWQVAALLIMAERIGKALRSPARDTIVSHATKHVGTGMGFGITEALDQLGALTGPLIFTGLFFFTGAATKTLADYQQGYSLLWLPLLLLLVSVFTAYSKFPAAAEPGGVAQPADRLSKVFWLYTAFSFVATLGFANFVLLGYHFKTQQLIPDAAIPFLYAVAMAVDGITALIIGKTYDWLKQRDKNELAGLAALSIIPALSVATAVLAFSNRPVCAVASMVLWGIVMGSHETIMKSAIADLTPLRKRGTGYGIFNTSYGVAIFIGSSLMGLCYDYSLALLVAVIAGVEVLALGLFFVMQKAARVAG